MKRIVLLALAASLATPAAAQERACRDIRALLNADGGDFRTVAWTIDMTAGAFATVQGRRVDFPAAKGCDINAEPGGWSDFTCRWEYAASAEAGAGYDRLLGRINPCLQTPLRPGEPFASGAVRLVQRHQGSFVTNARGTDVSLTLFEHVAANAATQSGAQPTRYVVELTVSVDTGRAASPEEAGEGPDSGG